MRRRPEENLDVIYSTNVFSNDAWSNSTQTNPNVDETVDLSKYAAPALPDTFTSTAKTARYAPSPHSDHYEPSGNVTNSEHDPFEHSAYDGRTSAPLKQNARFEDMPSPLRKRNLGLSHNSFVAESHVEPTQASVATPPAPTQPYAPAPTPAKNFQPTQTPPEQTNYSPQMPVPPAPPQTPIDSAIPNTDEVPLADFEREFIEEKSESKSQDQVIDLTAGTDTIHTNEPIVNPSLFTTSTIPTSTPAYEPIAYNTPDSIFGTQHLDISDSDRLYKDPREPRETIQIDLDLIKNLASKVSLKIAAIVLVVLLVLIGAYVFLGKSGTSTQNSPAGNAEPIIENQANNTDKTVIPPTEPAPNVEVPQLPTPNQQPNLNPDTSSQSGGGAILTYDENGNAVYSSPTNQNFNGE